MTTPEAMRPHSQPADLDALEALEKAATPGPWSVCDHERYGPNFRLLIGPAFHTSVVMYAIDLGLEQTVQREADLQAIAALRNAAAGLISELRATRREAAEAKATRSLGWLARALRAVDQDLKEWPAWMREDFERRLAKAKEQPNEPKN